jgi:hypothetical protein
MVETQRYNEARLKVVRARPVDTSFEIPTSRNLARQASNTHHLEPTVLCCLLPADLRRTLQLRQQSLSADQL